MMFLIKLGGSAISDKSKPLSFREDWVRTFAKALRDNLEGNSFMIIHGGGSYAHPMANSYGLGVGVRDQEQLVGVSLTSAVLELLSARLTLTMSKEGIPIYPIRTGSVYALVRGEPQVLVSYDLFLNLMRRGLVPMLHGDVVMSDGGLGIISGDDIMLDLGRALRPRAALFLMDVPGIMRNGEVIRFVRNVDLEVSGSGGIDVTGGLMRKLRRGLELSRYTEVIMCAIWDISSIVEIIRGNEPTRCTLILSS